jgi:Flp pilus assembly protein TadG
MSGIGARARRGDRGVVIVEVAIVIPLIFGLLFALADFSIAEVGNASGANAAREGARVGIINFSNADQTTSANYALIRTAVNAKLLGMVEAHPTITVTCMQANGITPTTYGCNPANVQVGTDLLKVTVRWTQVSALGLISDKHRSDSAVMRIIGTPSNGTTTTTSCTFSNMSVSPSSISETSGDLNGSITFSVNVNSTTMCGVPLISLPTQAGVDEAVDMVQNGLTTQYTYQYPPASSGDDGGTVNQNWSPAAYTAQVEQQQGAATASIPFTVTTSGTSSACVLGTVTPDFVSVPLQNKNSNSVKNNTTITVSLPVNNQTYCATPTAQVTGMTSPLNTATAMVWTSSANGYTLTISSSVNSSGWAVGVGSLVLTGPGGVQTTVPIQAG